MITTDDEARAWLDSQFTPDARQWNQLDSYAAALIAANERQNLVAASTLSTLWARHIADSAQLLCHDRNREGLWLDLGSGAGLPGLIIAILSGRPVWLVESRQLRGAFLEQVVSDLGLASRVTVQTLRLERLPTFAAATICARAFAPLPRLLRLAERFATPSTRWLLPKGQNAVKELAMLPRTWQDLFHVEQSLTDARSGIIVGHGTAGSLHKSS